MRTREAPSTVRTLGSVAVCIAAMLAAGDGCGGQQHAQNSGEDATPTGTDGPREAGSSQSPEAGPTTCIDFGPGPPTMGCRCSIHPEMIDVPIACGVALCNASTTEVIYCTNDGTLGYLEGISFTTCSQLKPCDAGDAGPAGDASDAGDAGAERDL